MKVCETSTMFMKWKLSIHKKSEVYHQNEIELETGNNLTFKKCWSQFESVVLPLLATKSLLQENSKMNWMKKSSTFFLAI